MPAIELLAIGAALTGFYAVQDPPAARPEAYARVVNCRTIADTAQRLACFDREVAAMETAEAGRQLVVLDRQQVRRTRRSLFGLTLPNLDIFGSGDDDEEGSSQIESTIRSARQDANGKWAFVLADGARWVQIDSRNLASDPRPGLPIRIRRAAMGSFLANVNNQVAIRVRRVN